MNLQRITRNGNNPHFIPMMMDMCMRVLRETRI